MTGDFKRHHDPTCAPFEQLKCDVLVTEATFGHESYEWPSPDKIFNAAATWIKKNQKEGISSVLSCYSLGKAQRILMELEQRGINEVFVSEKIADFNSSYKTHGFALSNAIDYANQSAPGTVIMISPGTTQHTLPENAEKAFFSGWVNPNSPFKVRGFAISDHADFPGLIETAQQSGAKRVLTIYGHTHELSRALRARGIASEPFEKPLSQLKLSEFWEKVNPWVI